MGRLTEAGYDASVRLDDDLVMRYQYPSRKGVGEAISFPPPLQSFIHHVFIETEDDEEVWERLNETMNLDGKSKISIGVVNALIRRITRGVSALESKPERERKHWIFVKRPQVLSSQDSARAVAALFRRVTFEKDRDEFIVRCRKLVFKLADQAFIYIGDKYLTSYGTAIALASWAQEISLKATRSHHIRLVARCIDHQRLNPSDADEAKHWDTVLQLADRLGAALKHHAPAEQILPQMFEQFIALNVSQPDPTPIPLEEVHSYSRGHGLKQVTNLQGTVRVPYPGQQHLPTATAGRTYPQSPFVNAPQPLISGQPTYPPNQYLGLPQPAAQQEYSYAPNPDPRSSRTTTAPKRQAQHTLDSGSSNSRPSTSGSNSSQARPSQGHARHESSPTRLRPEEQDLMSREKQIDIASNYAKQFHDCWYDARRKGSQAEAVIIFKEFMEKLVKALLGPSRHVSQSQLGGDEEQMRNRLVSNAMAHAMGYIKMYKDGGSPQARKVLTERMEKLVDTHNKIKDEYKAQGSQRRAEQERTDASYDVQRELNPELLSGPYRPLAPGWNEVTGGRPETTQPMVQRPREERGGQAGITGGKSSGREPISQEKKSSSSRGTGQERSSKNKPSSSGRKKRHG